MTAPTPETEDAALGAILRRFLTADEPYTAVLDYGSGTDLVLDGRVGLTPAEAALVRRIEP